MGNPAGKRRTQRLKRAKRHYARLLKKAQETPAPTTAPAPAVAKKD